MSRRRHLSTAAQHPGMRHVYPFPDGAAKRLRVGFYMSAIHLGGVERWAYSLAKELAGCYCDITGVLTRFVANVATAPDCRVFTEPDAPEFFASCDVVIAWFYEKEDVQLLSRFDGPVYAVSHGAHDNPWSVNTCRMMLQLPRARPVAVSRGAAQAFKLDTDVPIIYNGVGLDRSVIPRSPELKKKAGLGDKRVILYYGRLSSDKRPQKVAELMRHLDPARYAAIICGPGTEGFVTYIPRVEGVYVLKPVSHPAALFAIADCCVNFSMTESFCLSLFEAMAAQLPVFTSRWPVSDELEEILGEPLLTTPLDVSPEALASFVQHHLDAPDPARLARLQGTVLQRFSASHMASQWAKLLGITALDRLALHDHFVSR